MCIYHFFFFFLKIFFLIFYLRLILFIFLKFYTHIIGFLHGYYLRLCLLFLKACLRLHLNGLKILLTRKKFVRRKKYSFSKKIKSSFKGPKSLKMTETHFCQKA
jgi:hypothetical protein